MNEPKSGVTEAVEASHVPYKKLAAGVILQAIDDFKKVEDARSSGVKRVKLASGDVSVVIERARLREFFFSEDSSLRFFYDVIDMEPSIVRNFIAKNSKQ